MHSAQREQKYIITSQAEINGYYNVYEIDTANNNAVTPLSLTKESGSKPVGIAVNPIYHRAYVTCHVGYNKASSVSTINTDTYTVSSLSIDSLPGKPTQITEDAMGIAVSPQGDKVYVTKNVDGTLVIIDETGSEESIDPLSPIPYLQNLRSLLEPNL